MTLFCACSMPVGLELMWMYRILLIIKLCKEELMLSEQSAAVALQQASPLQARQETLKKILRLYLENDDNKKNPSQCWGIFAYFFSCLLRDPSQTYRAVIVSTIYYVTKQSAEFRSKDDINARVLYAIEAFIWRQDLKASDTGSTIDDMADLRSQIAIAKLKHQVDRNKCIQSYLTKLNTTEEQKSYLSFYSRCLELLDSGDYRNDFIKKSLSGGNHFIGEVDQLLEFFLVNYQVYTEMCTTLKNEYPTLQPIHTLMHLMFANHERYPRIAELALKNAVRIFCDRLESVAAFLLRRAAEMIPGASGLLSWGYKMGSGYFSNDTQYRFSFGSRLRESVSGACQQWVVFDMANGGFPTIAELGEMNQNQILLPSFLIEISDDRTRNDVEREFKNTQFVANPDASFQAMLFKLEKRQARIVVRP